MTRTFGLTAVLLMLGLFQAAGSNIYFPSNSRFSDDDILVFGDGDPVYMSVGEWKDYNGKYDYFKRAAAPAMKWLSGTGVRAAKAQQQVQQALQHATEQAAVGLRSFSPVPEPSAAIILIAAGMFRLFLAGWKRASKPGRAR